MTSRYLLLFASLVLASCASTPRPAPPAQAPTAAPAQVAVAPAAPLQPPPGPAAPPAPAVAPSGRTASAELMAVEKQWLASWFQGTPVTVAQVADGSVTVAVPREHCFDAGNSRVKPPLGAVLDKVAESLRRRPATQLVQLAAPEDRSAAKPLALARAEQMRRHLLGRGIASQRLAEAKAGPDAGVLLRLAAAL